MPKEDRAALVRALDYPESTAGRLMKTEFVAVPRSWTLGQSLDYVRGERMEILPDRILIYAEKGEELLTKIIEAGKHPVTSLVRRSSLEDVFLRLTGRTLID